MTLIIISDTVFKVHDLQLLGKEIQTTRWQSKTSLALLILEISQINKIEVCVLYMYVGCCEHVTITENHANHERSVPLEWNMFLI